MICCSSPSVPLQTGVAQDTCGPSTAREITDEELAATANADEEIHQARELRAEGDIRGALEQYLDAWNTLERVSSRPTRRLQILRELVGMYRQTGASAQMSADPVRRLLDGYIEKNAGRHELVEEAQLLRLGLEPRVVRPVPPPPRVRAPSAANPVDVDDADVPERTSGVTGIDRAPVGTERVLLATGGTSAALGVALMATMGWAFAAGARADARGESARQDPSLSDAEREAALQGALEDGVTANNVAIATGISGAALAAAGVALVATGLAKRRVRLSALTDLRGRAVVLEMGWTF